MGTPAQGSFQGLGFLGGVLQISSASAVSADGSVVVGGSHKRRRAGLRRSAGRRPEWWVWVSSAAAVPSQQRCVRCQRRRLGGGRDQFKPRQQQSGVSLDAVRRNGWSGLPFRRRGELSRTASAAMGRSSSVAPLRGPIVRKRSAGHRAAGWPALATSAVGTKSCQRCACGERRWLRGGWREPECVQPR